jgi:beta-N-acetylhexosaminidase
MQKVYVHVGVFMSYDTGLRFIVEPQGIALTELERSQLRELRPAGVMLRKRNFATDFPYEAWLEQLTSLLGDIREACQRDNLIISIDHEGGRVVRPPLPITRFPYASRWREQSFAVGRAHAEELISLGINLTFSPCVDIHSNPDNPVINARAFGRTAEEVVAYAQEYIRGLNEFPIGSCIKHFPGHGDTATDSHWGVPVVQRTRDEIYARELAPFRALVASGIDLVMTAHIVAPAIDTERATISRVFLHDILRAEFGFSGVIVADALGMHAIKDELLTGSFIKAATKATLDLFLVVGDDVSIATAVTMKNNLETALQEDRACAVEHELAIARISAYIKKLPSAQAPYALNADTFARNMALAQSLEGRQEWDLIVPGFE